jgi:protein-S-isoprenylcysteine O-methyltransferase Ste14
MSMAVSFFTKMEILAGLGLVKAGGALVFCLGLLLFVFAALELKSGFWGNVQPVSERLVTSGPYRVVRHPGYLGMVVSVVGLALGMRSAWGLAAGLFVFAPLGVCRAKLEERELAEKHGRSWEEYRQRTYFMVPLIY